MPVVQYVESHLQRLSSNSLSDSDLLALLGGEGGSQVDAVFYLISRGKHTYLHPVTLPRYVETTRISDHPSRPIGRCKTGRCAIS